MPEPIPLAYTFGNHMHWVDMQWLWGNDVLPSSVRDMLHLCRETGARACINFDAIGYEKLAAEAPEAFAELREAIQQRTVEVSGGSYGQPYGQFHGGESNVRQLIFGVRAAQRLFRTPAQVFWEEEFDAFPQLPQMLAGVGIQGAALYFQWTWHTPEVPLESAPVVLWEGIDGTRLPAATRNRLNLHQWPEDFQILLDELSAEGPVAVLRKNVDPARLHDGPTPTPLVLQWLELMPNPDWMCRSELMAPKLRELLEDPRFAVRHILLSDYLREAAHTELPVRAYAPHEMWHGLSLGKNGYEMVAASAHLEAAIQSAEALHAVTGLFGRPYPRWDVYPTWTLEEAWRELLTAQHHDNEECEWLCAEVAKAGHARIHQLVAGGELGLDHLAARLSLPEGHQVVWNPLGFARQDPSGAEVPGFGYAVVPLTHAPDAPSQPLPLPAFRAGGHPWSLHGVAGGTLTPVQLEGLEGVRLDLVVPEPEQPGYGGAARLSLHHLAHTLWAESPYAVHPVQPGGPALRKYPTEDWMTSPQWFEEVEGWFHTLGVVDFVQADGSGLVVGCPHPTQWFADPQGYSLILNLRDPWDQGYAVSSAPSIWILPHSAPLAPHQLWRLGRSLGRPMRRAEGRPVAASGLEPASRIPPATCGFCQVSAPNVVPVALYRESEAEGRRWPGYAGLGLRDPYLLRLVEFDGVATSVDLTLNATVAAAFRTDLLGRTLEPLEPSPLRLALRPREIATLVLDLVEGRKEPRDLDARREVWATVHRVDAP